MTPTVSLSLANAAGILLNHRMQYGSGDTGWSRAWVISCYARLFNGDSAWNSVEAFIKTYPLTNLFNSNNGPPMQIDGNFGFTAGVTELFLQSHADLVHLLPALPSAVPSGSVTGLVARGGFVVDISWSNGALTSATITSNLGNSIALRVAGGTSFNVNGQTYSGPIDTKVGGVYTVSLGPGNGSTSTSTTQISSTSTTTSTSTSSSSTATAAAQHWGQCGGIGWTGPTQCISPYTCQAQNPYYSQCL